MAPASYCRNLRALPQSPRAATASLTRRIWVRRGTHVDQVAVLEASPRLERIEQAIESVAIEVERISEAQRFSARLLAERGAEAVDHRAASRPLSAPRSITPH